MNTAVCLAPRTTCTDHRDISQGHPHFQTLSKEARLLVQLIHAWLLVPKKLFVQTFVAQWTFPS
jgi:hypothetical protein